MVYPNPTSGAFNVRIANPDQERTLLRLFDSRGQLIEERQWDKNEMSTIQEVPFTFHEPGIYFLNIQIGKTLSTEKVIVR